MTTFQLRRYELEPELAEDFVSWVVNDIFPLRETFGFRVEWSFFDRAKSELVWMAAADCTQAEFEAQATPFSTAIESGWLFQGARFSGFEQFLFG